MMGHKICFYGEIWLIIPKSSLLPLLMWSTDIQLSTTRQTWDQARGLNEGEDFLILGRSFYPFFILPYTVYSIYLNFSFSSEQGEVWCYKEIISP